MTRGVCGQEVCGQEVCGQKVWAKVVRGHKVCESNRWLARKPHRASKPSFLIFRVTHAVLYCTSCTRYCTCKHSSTLKLARIHTHHVLLYHTIPRVLPVLPHTCTLAGRWTHAFHYEHAKVETLPKQLADYTKLAALQLQQAFGDTHELDASGGAMLLAATADRHC